MGKAGGRGGGEVAGKNIHLSLTFAIFSFLSYTVLYVRRNHIWLITEREKGEGGQGEEYIYLSLTFAIFFRFLSVTVLYVRRNHIWLIRNLLRSMVDLTYSALLRSPAVSLRFSPSFPTSTTPRAKVFSMAIQRSYSYS